MKRFLFLSVIALFLCTGANGQWYQKKYGVDSLTDLTRSQLGEALKSENKLALGSLILSTSGILITASGFYMANNEFTLFGNLNPNVKDWIFLAPLGIALTAVGIIGSTVFFSRGSQIKEALGSPELKLGMLACPMQSYPGTRGSSAAFGVTLTYSF